jgi:hypothetical protein
MGFKRGDTCYILENNPHATRVKIVSKQDKTYIVQLIGSCGALKLPEERLFATAEEAEASRKPPKASVSVQLSDNGRKSNIIEIQHMLRK